MTPRVAIIYLSFHSEPYIEDVANALAVEKYPKDALEFVIVDNPHPQYGSSVPYLQANILPRSGKDLPKVTILPQNENTGFAGGNNKGVEYALANNFDYVFFLNNDAYPGPNTFAPLVTAMEADQKIAIAQSFIRLHPNRHLINTSGNCIHFLGFGYCRDYRVPVEQTNYSNVIDVPYASGAAFMVRASFIREYGAWDQDFFLYHEDMEWSLRAKVLGYRVVMVRASEVFHAYDFKRSISKYFWMERNRFAVWLMYLKGGTLLLIAPAVLMMEIGSYLFAQKGGWAGEKHKVYKYWLDKTNRALWIDKRKKIQALRLITDKQLMADFTGRVDFQEPDMESAILKYIANPFFSAYWAVAKWLIFW
ncbi:MAG: hypothetical protein HW383_663 [Candidatus Magasanikbacteria bacterium]|nr:hypothetical protein [Candidatus Magasanikbacteria bacterium]